MPSFFNADFQQMLYTFLIRLIIALTALPVHECAHAYAAMRMGDRTAERQGRLTLNPLAHFDPIGTTAIILFGFGWAKPVPINPLNFENPKKGMMLSALAGPLSNIGMAFLAVACYKLTPLLAYIGVGAAFVSTLTMFFFYAASINISLGVFNLIPIPPLDGSRIATYFLPQRTYFKIMQYERYIFIAFFMILWLGILDTPITFVDNLVIQGLNFITLPIDWLVNAIIR